MEITKRFGVPGRLRLEVRGLKSNPSLAAHLEALARTVEGVTGARSSVLTGSLLVLYSPAVLADPAQIVDRLEAGLRGGEDPAGSPAGSREFEPLLRALKLAGVQDSGHLLAPGGLTVLAFLLSTCETTLSATLLGLSEGRRSSALQRLGVAEPRRQVLVLALLLAAVSGPGRWVGHARERAWKRSSAEVEHILRTRLFEHLENQGLGFFEEHGSGQLLALLTTDVSGISALVAELDGVFESLLTLAVGGWSLLRRSPRSACVAALSIPMMLVPMKSLKPQRERAFAARSQAHAALSRALDNIFSGIVEVKGFTAEELEYARIEELSRDLAEAAAEAARVPSKQSALASNIYQAGYIPAITFGVLRVLSGDLSSESLHQSNHWYPRLVVGLGRLQSSVSTYYSAIASSERVVRVLDESSATKDGRLRVRRNSVRGRIQFDRVEFSYDPVRPVLREVSLEVAPGRSLGLVGLSGSGKSTLLKLLLRFYDPDAGRVLLDGKDLRRLRLADLRASVALVSQDVYLFSGSVRHNVLYGRAGASDREIEAALQAAGAGDLLDSLPDGLSTDVGEHGSRLSGGQRQRVAIARALLKDAPILALDEPTAHLDYATEAAVKASLDAATRGRTMILVAHRLTSVRNLDRIVVMDGGQIAEQGTHDDLLARRGIYSRLWELQS